MSFAFLDPWHLFLPREPGHVVALSGSGGKTTILTAIANVWAAEGRAALATTTTRTEPVSGFTPFADAGVPPGPGLSYRHGGVRGDGKWEGLSPAAVDAEGLAGGGLLVVAEVDGAAKAPFKYYRAGEPVWPSRTSLAIVVMGVGGIGEMAGAVVHRLGRADSLDPVGVGPHEVWQWDHAHALLTGPGGYLDQVPAQVPVVLALAGLEQQPDSVGLFEFTGRAMEHPRVPLVLFCSRAETGLSLRAAFREAEEGSSAPS